MARLGGDGPAHCADVPAPGRAVSVRVTGRGGGSGSERAARAGRTLPGPGQVRPGWGGGQPLGGERGAGGDGRGSVVRAGPGPSGRRAGNHDILTGP